MRLIDTTKVRLWGALMGGAVVAAAGFLFHLSPFPLEKVLAGAIGALGVGMALWSLFHRGQGPMPEDMPGHTSKECESGNHSAG